jgi:hypothetical protein
MIAHAKVFLAALAVVGLGSCRSSSGGSQVELGAAASVPGASAVSPTALPPPCVEFLGQLQCWLRASGNGPDDVEHAVSNARASFEAHPQRAESCERAMVYRHQLIASTGCAHAGEAPKLPPGVAADCPPTEHFFVRQDGHVSGCHRDCTLPADCPGGSSCTGLGSAAGGPIDERFCE